MLRLERFRGAFSTLLAVLLSAGAVAAADPPSSDDMAEARRPADDAELREWLTNMIVWHGFSTAEVSAATGMSAGEIDAALARLAIDRDARPTPRAGQPLVVLPYPGGRHPRVGFLDGAVRPQRETKVSVFTPWDGGGYVVVDVPEAIWSNLGLTYLAHTHVPTLWTKAGVALERLEWSRAADGALSIARRLPNGIEFGADISPKADHVAMRLWLRNGTEATLTNMRVQNCVMLAHAQGFAAQTSENKVHKPPFAACRSADGRRWVITAWTPNHRAWDNPPCPCIHSDPKLPDCAPGETTRAVGWLSFYEGDDPEAEFARIDATGWREGE